MLNEHDRSKQIKELERIWGEAELNPEYPGDQEVAYFVLLESRGQRALGILELSQETVFIPIVASRKADGIDLALVEQNKHLIGDEIGFFDRINAAKANLAIPEPDRYYEYLHCTGGFFFGYDSDQSGKLDITIWGRGEGKPELMGILRTAEHAQLYTEQLAARTGIHLTPISSDYFAS